MITDTQQRLLDILSSALFGAQMQSTENVDWINLLREADQQAVFPLVFSKAYGLLPDEVSQRFQDRYCAHITIGIRNDYRHGELHRLLDRNGIRYVVIKGMASASYYPDPFLRTMGDVDFLVAKQDIPQVKQLLLDNGFSTNDQSNHHAHLAFHKDEAVLEMHWEPNGIPDGEKGDNCRRYLKDILDARVECRTQNEVFYVPDAFHHGLVILIHTARHMINTGIGLRHLCDWAVFAGALSDTEFRQLFEQKLRETGLWRFAQLITQTSVRYLGCPAREWAMEDMDDGLLESIISDVFDAGNFGKKDLERINQAKLITTRGSATVDGSGMTSHLFGSLTEKAYKIMPACKRFKILLPMGWTTVGINHFRKIIKGSRPEVHVCRMISGAEERKEIYQQFHLFQ